jgi:hypothetical protein
MNYEGYTLEQYNEVEFDGDNSKNFHFITDPAGERHWLDHSPYDWIEMDDFVKYVEFHKAEGRMPKESEIRG